MAADERLLGGNHRLDMENLKAQWSFATRQRERAELEYRMWMMTPPGTRSVTARREWVRTVLNIPLQVAELRSMLHLAKPESDLLWERIDGPERMSIYSAASILRRASQRAITEGITRWMAVKQELAEYDTWPILRQSESGSFRKRRQGNRWASTPPPPPSAPTPPASTPTPVPPPPPSTPLRAAAPSPPPSSPDSVPARKRHTSPGARARWDAVRDAVRQIVEHDLGHLDGHARATLTGQLEAEIDGAIKVLQNRIGQAKKAAKLDAIPLVELVNAPSRRALRGAYQLLGVDAPRGGGPLSDDAFAQAKRNFKRLVREYHPDRGGNAAQYDAVVKAMSLLTELQQQPDTKGT